MQAPTNDSSQIAKKWGTDVIQALQRGNYPVLTSLLSSDGPLAAIMREVVADSEHALMLKYFCSRDFQKVPEKKREKLKEAYTNALRYEPEPYWESIYQDLPSISGFLDKIQHANPQYNDPQWLSDFFQKIVVRIPALIQESPENLHYCSIIGNFYARHKLYDEAFYLHYLVYYNEAKDRLKQLLVLIGIILDTHTSTFIDARDYLFQELTDELLTAKPDKKVANQILAFLLQNKSKLTKPEKRMLCDFILNRDMNLTLEERFIFFIQIYKKGCMPYMDIVLNLARLYYQADNLINGQQICTLLENLFLKPNTELRKYLLLQLHDKIAKKANITTLQQKLSKQPETEAKTENLSSKMIIDLIQACMENNIECISKLIKEIISDTKTFPVKLATHPISYVGAFGDSILDYLGKEYLNAPPSVITWYLLESYNIKLISLLSSETLVTLIDYREFFAFISKAILCADDNFVECLMAKLEHLPIAIEARVFFLNKNNGSRTLLECAFESGRERVALQLYKMGGRSYNIVGLQFYMRRRRSCYNIASDKQLKVLIEAALSKGFFTLAKHLLHTEIILKKDPSLLTARSGFGLSQRTANLGLPLSKIDSSYLTIEQIENLLTSITSECLEEDHSQSLHQKLTRQVTIQNLLSKRRIRLSKGAIDILFNYCHEDYSILYTLTKTGMLTGRHLAQILQERIDLVAITLMLKHIDIFKQENVEVLQHMSTHLSGIELFRVMPLIPVPKNSMELLAKCYLLFKHEIVHGQFGSHIITYILHSLPPLTTQIEQLELDTLEFVSLVTFLILSSAYHDNSETFRNLFQRYIGEKRRYTEEITQLRRGIEDILYPLANFLLFLRPDDFAFIKEKLHSTNDVISTFFQDQQLYSQRYTNLESEVANTFLEDDIDSYKVLSRQYSEYFNSNFGSHLILASNSNQKSRILDFMLKQYELGRSKLTPQEKTIFLRHLIEKEFLDFLARALQSGITDPCCTTTYTDSNCLYLVALRKGKLKCADSLMPTHFTSELLMETAKFGNVALLKRALNANSRLGGREDSIVSYEELEQICIDDKDKLTAIALSRNAAKTRFEYEHGTAHKKPRYKIKNSRPSGEQLFQQFKHQLDILNSYAKTHLSSIELTEDDLDTCKLTLKELIFEYHSCGIKNLKTGLQDDAVLGQLTAFVKNLENEFKNIKWEEKLAATSIYAQLEVISSFRSKQAGSLPAIKPEAAQSDNQKKKSKKKKKKKLSPATSTNEQVIVISSANSLYNFTLTQQENSAHSATIEIDKTDQKPKIAETSSIINADIKAALNDIKTLVEKIADVHEAKNLPQEVFARLFDLCIRLKGYFVELDEDVANSPFLLYKQQLDLLDCEMTENNKQQLILFALQFLNTPIKEDLNDSPQRSTTTSKSLSFFKPAILLEDVNQFCIQRLAELRKLIVEPFDHDAIHCCIFRLVNALGDIYRPARLLRHYLIHYFYHVDTRDLTKLAEILLTLDFSKALSSNKGLLAIEQSPFYHKARDQLQGFIRTKSEKQDFGLLNERLNKSLIAALNADNQPKAVWYATLLGEYANVHKLDGQRDTVCRMIRNRFAHEDYKAKPDETGATYGVPSTLLQHLRGLLTAQAIDSIMLSTISP